MSCICSAGGSVWQWHPFFERKMEKATKTVCVIIMKFLQIFLSSLIFFSLLPLCMYLVSFFSSLTDRQTYTDSAPWLVTHTHTQIDTYVCISIADFIQLIWPDFASENLLSNGQLGILSFLLPLLPSCCVGYLFLAHSHLIHHSALSELPMYIYLVANAFEQSLCMKSPFFLPPGNETNVTRIWTLILFSFFHLEKQLSRINTLGYR